MERLQVSLFLLFIFALNAAAQNSSVELAMGDLFAEENTFIGASAILSIWTPYVESVNEYSASQVTLASNNSLNIIDVGWHVYPILYGDNETHLFVRWTIFQEGGRLGCFNTLCQGFIQVSSNILVGANLDTVSYMNDSQATTNVSILQGTGGSQMTTNRLVTLYQHCYRTLPMEVT